ncbi:hypothetical protein DL96DRAFT_1821645 [Flagelloscypha sp. PMI_526]|nr:hypothetical protein DL96DRAFT_1821645 [Flagelloscypha sp. PMI_526]
MPIGTCWQNIDDSSILLVFSFLWQSQGLNKQPCIQSLELYREVQNRVGEAHVHRSFGDLHHRQNRLDAAEVSFALALKLYHEAQNGRGEANTYQSIGYLHVRRYRLDAAEASFARALQIYCKVQDRLGEANTYKSIGKIHAHRDRLDAAEASFARALALYHEIQNRLGEANTHQSIASFALALELFREVQNRLGEANTHKSIGSLHKRRDQLDAAESSFALALELYREIQDRWGEASTVFSIGGLYQRRDRLDAAEASFALALQLYREVQNPLGEANTHQLLVSFTSGGVDWTPLKPRSRVLCGSIVTPRTDGAKQASTSLLATFTSAGIDWTPLKALFARALELYCNVQDRSGEASTHKSIGKLHVRRDRLDKAEAPFTRALELYQQVQHRWGEASVHQSIGELHVRRDRLDAAEASTARALEYFNELQDRSDIATCVLSQGRMRLRTLDTYLICGGLQNRITLLATSYLINDRLGDADTSLHLALDMYTTQVESRIDEALVNRSIGELHLRRELFDDSERVFRRALELDILAHSQVGQAQSHWGLGKTFMAKRDLSSAESSYSDALQLFFNIDDYQATPCLLDLGKVWVSQGKMEEDNGSDIELLKCHWNRERIVIAETE